MDEHNIPLPPQGTPLGPNLPPQPGFVPFKIGGLFRRTWQIYKSRFWIFLGIIVIPALITTILTTAIVFLGGFSIKSLFFSVLYGDLSLYFFVALLILIFSSVTFSWIFMSLIYANQLADGRKKLIECLKLGWFKIVSSIWIYLLICICILGWNILLVFFGVFLMIQFSVPWQLIWIIGFMPSMLFLTWFVFGFYILATEKLKGTRALVRSKELVKGYGWRVFASIFLIWATALSLQWFTEFIPHIGNYLGLLLPILYLPFLISFLSVLYRDLRDAKKDQPMTGSRKKTAIIIIISLLLIPLSVFAIYKLFIGGIIQKTPREVVPIENGTYEQYGLILKLRNFEIETKQYSYQENPQVYIYGDFAIENPSQQQKEFNSWSLCLQYQKPDGEFSNCLAYASVDIEMGTRGAGTNYTTISPRGEKTVFTGWTSEDAPLDMSKYRLLWGNLIIKELDKYIK